VDAAAGRVSVETSRQSVVAARNALNSASSERPHAIDQQLALVDAADALVRSAQKDVADGTLNAPSDGVVSAINGVVGEYLSPSSGTTALAPGSRAAIPGSASAGAAGTGAAATRPGGSQFLVLSSLKGFQAVPFEESDAAKITPKQRVAVTFDAIPDLTETGTVVAVAIGDCHLRGDQLLRDDTSWSRRPPAEGWSNRSRGGDHCGTTERAERPQ
jgi:HlyD family secretion protein